jgi:hypothetical protein
MARNGTISDKKGVALEALLEAPSVVEAARVAGLGVRTLFRWLREDEAFQEAYMSARRESMSHAISWLQQAASKAVTTLEKVMATDDEPAGSRVSAAKTVLEMATKGIEVLDMERRISALEAGRPHTNGRSGRFS